MKIFLRIIATVLLLVFWFCVCGLLWSRLFPLEWVYWLAHCFGIFGDEDIYDFAALLCVMFAAVCSIIITIMTLIFSSKRS